MKQKSECCCTCLETVRKKSYLLLQFKGCLGLGFQNHLANTNDQQSFPELTFSKSVWISLSL